MNFLYGKHYYQRKNGYILLLPVLLWFYKCKISWALPAKLVLYPSSPGEEAIEINGTDCPFGAYFTNTNSPFGCACITGVWAFYGEKCTRPSLIAAGVDNHCFELKSKISKVTLISPPSLDDASSSSIAIFSKNMSLLNGRILLEKNIPSGNIDKSTLLTKDFSFVTTGESSWTVKTPSDSCLKPEPQSTNNFYCSFEVSNGMEGVMDVEGSCNDNATENIKPLTCSPFLTGSGSCPFSPLLFTDKNKGSNASEGGKQQGRFFLSGSLQMKNYSSKLTKEDITKEDFLRWPANTSEDIRSEIWNYMISKAEKLAGLKKEQNHTDKVLPFRLLEMSKTLLQNVCPDHFVKDTIFDVAIAVFINVQKNAFKFEEIETDYPTEKRIEKALTECMNNMTKPYPFLNQKSNYYNRTHTANCTDYIMGTFEMYDFTSELSVAPTISSMSHDPIIDAAWQTFSHAHSACYPFFNPGDHHRFTTIMIPLFTNGINDFWYRGNFSLKEDRDPYSDSLGNLFMQLYYIDHCSHFSRLESKYPWDLVRPAKRTESARKRRDISREYQCIKDKYQNDCS